MQSVIVGVFRISAFCLLTASALGAHAQVLKGDVAQPPSRVVKTPAPASTIRMAPATVVSAQAPVAARANAAPAAPASTTADRAKKDAKKSVKDGAGKSSTTTAPK